MDGGAAAQSREGETSALGSKTVKPTDEQIRAILSGDTWDWALAQLSAGERIYFKRFRDFIQVNEKDVEQYVAQHGFDARVVFESSEPGAWLRIEAGDHICIANVGRIWEVFYTERGERHSESRFPTREEAVREVVHRLIEGARICLNHRYRLSHPDENLPSPSEMD
jgi:hypothetical protein